MLPLDFKDLISIFVQFCTIEVKNLIQEPATWRHYDASPGSVSQVKDSGQHEKMIPHPMVARQSILAQRDVRGASFGDCESKNSGEMEVED